MIRDDEMHYNTLPVLVCLFSQREREREREGFFYISKERRLNSSRISIYKNQ